MAAPRKYDDATRKRILELHVHERRSAQDVADLLTREGTVISVHTVRQIAGEEKRQDLTERPKAQQLAHLLAGLVQATSAEISRVQANKGEDTADSLLKLARTIREIEPLLTDKPAGKGSDTPKTTLGSLASVPEPPSSPTSEPVRTARSLRA